MKIKWNGKYNTIAYYSCISAGIIVLIFCLLINFSGVKTTAGKLLNIINPVIIGIIIAYLFNPLFRIYENKVFTFIEKKKPRKSLKRAIALTATYLSFLILFSLFVTFIVPQIVKSYTQLQSKAADYVTELLKWFDGYAGDSGAMRELYNKLMSYADAENLKNTIGNFLSNSLDIILSSTAVVFGYAVNVFKQIKNIIFGLILSVYFLASKEYLIGQVKKAIKAVFKDKIYRIVRNLVLKTDRIFGGYIIGSMLDSLMVGIILFIVLAIFDIPYYPLIAVICGITNMIPFFGPFIGAIPSVFITFVASPIKALWLIAIILILQQIDGNLIAPKIIGDQTGLKPFWIIFAITIMGGLLGILGMFIGVPLFAVIYTIIKEEVEKKLAERNLPVETEDYISDPDYRHDCQTKTKKKFKLFSRNKSENTKEKAPDKAETADKKSDKQEKCDKK